MRDDAYYERFADAIERYNNLLEPASLPRSPLLDEVELDQARLGPWRSAPGRRSQP
jgi:hypothetical protein